MARSSQLPGLKGAQVCLSMSRGLGWYPTSAGVVGQASAPVEKARPVSLRPVGMSEGVDREVESSGVGQRAGVDVSAWQPLRGIGSWVPEWPTLGPLTPSEAGPEPPDMEG